MILYSSFFRAQYGVISATIRPLIRLGYGAAAYDLRENVNLSVEDRDGARMVCRSGGMA